MKMVFIKYREFKQFIQLEKDNLSIMARLLLPILYFLFLIFAKRKDVEEN